MPYVGDSKERETTQDLERSAKQYFEEKSRYAATIKREKTRSRKEYCNLTSANHWKEVYKLAAGKRNTSIQITTLRKADGLLTADTK